MTELLAVVGPTASGKSALAIEIARELGTEIISADSMQFYRGMEIGTAAPSIEQRRLVRHHFVGFLEPGREFSAGQYERLARERVDELRRRGLAPVAVGGSGLYVSALIDGLFSGPAKSPSIRARLHDTAQREGVPVLYQKLLAVDPDYAAIIQENDLRRIVRALEVYELTGEALSALHRRHRSNRAALDAVQIALDWPRDVLYERIEARVDEMLEQGFVEEVRSLLDKGYGPRLDRLRTLGYREIAAHLEGAVSLDEAVETIKRNTRRYAKRQLTWFRGDPRINWIPVEDRRLMDIAAEVLREYDV